MKIKGGTWIAMLILTAGIIVLGASLAMKLGENLILYIAIAFVLIVDISVISNAQKEKREKSCSKCKTQFDFDDISYHEISRYTKTHSYNPSKSDRQIVESLTYKVQFDCTCANCGSKKSYVKKIHGGNAYSDGTVDIVDPEQAIESYYRGRGLSINNKSSNIFSSIIGIICLVIAIVMFNGGIDLGPTGADKLEASDYYGTYYAVTDEYTEYQLIISDRRVQLKKAPLLDSSTIQTFDNGEQVFYGASYMAKQDVEYKVADCGALVLDRKYVFWITKTGDSPEFTVFLENGDKLVLTTEEKTISSMVNDPKDYYGTYYYGSNNSIRINSSNINVNLDGNSSNGTWYYRYVNRAMLEKYGLSGYSSGIIAYNGSQYICFGFSGDDLIMKGGYKFEKQ